MPNATPLRLGSCSTKMRSLSAKNFPKASLPYDRICPPINTLSIEHEDEHEHEDD
jgi:hypothetical protein